MLALLFMWLSVAVNAFNAPTFSFDRIQFEQAMYARSGGMLSEQEYKKLIDPFLDKAERELKSVQFCEENQECAACQSYYMSLLDYNVACFLNYAQDNEKTNSDLEKKKAELKSSIGVLACKHALKHDEIEAELQKTEQLFLEGNEAFYAALPLRVKFGLWLKK